MATLRRAWSTGQVVLGAHPSAYLPFARRRYGNDLAFGPRTEVVIEGFPRSANSFAVNAFVLAQGRTVSVAHHLHAPAQVMAAARAGVPAIVLLREPADAILSYLLWQPHLRPSHAVRHYLGFYEPLEELAERFVVATFEQVTTDFGSVIHRTNQRFSSDFAEFEHTEDNVAACFDTIETNSRRQHGGALVEQVVARPSEERRRRKDELRGRFEADTSRRVRERLAALHARFEEMAR
jgi:hypothetical protein